MSNIHTALVSVQSEDNIELPGLLFSPTTKTDTVAIWLHGMGDNGVFYNPGRINALASSLCDRKIALLAFNNRGAHNRKNLKISDETLPEEERTYIGGTHYEKIADCVLDINGAAQFLKKQGYSELYLAGHSTGANKICAYHVRTKQNHFSKYVLAGPGDDSGLFYQELGEKKFWLALEYAKRAINKGQPLQLMPNYTGMHPFSAQSALDILDPDGDYNTFPFFETTTNRLGTKKLFFELSQINKPLLAIVGEFDEYMYTAGSSKKALEILQKYTSSSIISKSDYQVVQGTDHGFHDAEITFAEQVGDWLMQK